MSNLNSKATAALYDALREIKWIRASNGYAECEPTLWLAQRLDTIERDIVAALGFEPKAPWPAESDSGERGPVDRDLAVSKDTQSARATSSDQTGGGSQGNGGAALPGNLSDPPPSTHSCHVEDCREPATVRFDDGILACWDHAPEYDDPENSVEIRTGERLWSDEDCGCNDGGMCGPHRDARGEAQYREAVGS